MSITKKSKTSKTSTPISGEFTVKASEAIVRELFTLIGSHTVIGWKDSVSSDLISVTITPQHWLELQNAIRNYTGKKKSAKATSQFSAED